MFDNTFCFQHIYLTAFMEHHGRDRMVVGFTTSYASSACPHESDEFEPRSWRGVLDTTLCDKVCQCFATSLWFSSDTLVSSTNATDRHDINKILLKVAQRAINQLNQPTTQLLWKDKINTEINTSVELLA